MSKKTTSSLLILSLLLTTACEPVEDTTRALGQAVEIAQTVMSFFTGDSDEKPKKKKKGKKETPAVVEYEAPTDPVPPPPEELAPAPVDPNLIPSDPNAAPVTEPVPSAEAPPSPPSIGEPLSPDGIPPAAPLDPMAAPAPQDPVPATAPPVVSAPVTPDTTAASSPTLTVPPHVASPAPTPLVPEVAPPVIVQNTELPTPPKVRDPSIPLEPLEHFGGVPTSLDLGDSHVFIGFGRKLVYTDSSLKPQGSLNLESSVVSVTALKKDLETFLYIKEAGNVLEIARFSQGGKPAIVKSFQVDGAFDGGFSVTIPTMPVSPPADAASPTPAPLAPSQQIHVYVYLQDRVQALDLTRPEEIQVAYELPMASVRQVHPLGRYLYVARGPNLDVVSSDTKTVLSSIAMGSPFKLLGLHQEKDKEFLIAGMQDATGKKWQGIQLLPLAKGYGGISDAGHTVKLSAPADFVVRDSGQPQLYLIRDGQLALFDLSQKKELAAPGAPMTGLNFLQGEGGVLFAVGDRQYGKFQMDKASSTDEGKKGPENVDVTNGADAFAVPDIPALASMPPEDEAKKGEIKWGNALTVPFPANILQFLLIGPQSALFVDGGVTKDQPALYYSTNMWTGAETLLPLKMTSGSSLQFSMMKPAEFGTLLYESQLHKIFAVKKDFSSVDPIEGISGPLAGLASVFDGKTDYLYVTTRKKGTEGETALHVYTLETANTAKKAASLPLQDVGGVTVYAKGAKALLACGLEGTCVVDLATQRPAMALTATAKPAQPGVRAVEVAVGPGEKIGYVFYEGAPSNSVGILDLSTAAAKELAVIPGLTMTADQFRGLTFSSGGTRLILPLDSGLSVYDVTKPSNPLFLFKWNLGKTHFADVTNRGLTLCGSLGSFGVECGNFVTPAAASAPTGVSPAVGEQVTAPMRPFGNVPVSQPSAPTPAPTPQANPQPAPDAAVTQPVTPPAPAVPSVPVQ